MRSRTIKELAKLNCSPVVLVLLFAYTLHGYLDFCISRRCSVDPSYLSCRIPISMRKGAIPAKGDKHHAALHGSRCLHRRSFGNHGEKSPRPQRPCEGTDAESRWTNDQPLFLLWRVRCRCHW